MRLLCAALCAALLHGATATAQVYPAKPITIVVPFTAGGPADVLARAMSERMRQTLGQPLVIENVAGAAGSLGVGRVARAAADGYTIGIGHLGTHVFNGALYPLQYDLVTDLVPIALLPSTPSVIIAKTAVPAKDLKELIAWLKANPDQATIGTAGIGSAAHIASLYFTKATGVELRVVPYRSGGAPLNDLVAGHISVMFDQAANSAELVRSGKVRAYAVTAKARLPSAPEIPTVDQAGVPGLYMSTWYGFWAPKGTPRDIIARLNAAVVDALSDPALAKQMTDRGSDIPARAQMTPEALAAFQRAEIDKWWPIIKAAGIKVDGDNPTTAPATAAAPSASAAVSRLPALPSPPTDPILITLFGNIEGRGGRVLNIHRTVGHAPKVLRAQAGYANALREDVSLPRPLQVLVVLRTAQVNDSPYEPSVHRRNALALGIPAAKVDALSSWRTSPLFDPRERAALAFTDQAAASGEVDEAVFAEASKTFSPQEIVELGAIVSWYVGNARFTRALRIKPEQER